MKHLGDITQIKGSEIEPVDIVVGGSPCQDLSIAGERKGVLHADLGDEETTRSGLFIEQIRVTKELREYDRNVRGRTVKSIRPRWSIWENVPGTLSHGGGETFRIILEEFCKIADNSVSVSLPEKGKWQPHGVIVGDGWSVGWTTHNAAAWCVPQNRTRISVICDFGGERVGELLFDPESSPWNAAESEGEGQSDAVNSGGGFTEGSGVIALDSNPTDGRLTIAKGNVCQTLKARAGTGGNNAPLIYTTSKASYHTQCVKNAVSCLVSTDYKEPPTVTVDGRIRRITPTEAERLQGFPDGWTDIGDWVDSKGKTHKCTDSMRYKALGNSIATGNNSFWKWVLKRIAAQSTRELTMGSLFDGIGGFPYIHEQLNGKGSCLWASEVEEFCIEVTKRRFPE